MTTYRIDGEPDAVVNDGVIGAVVRLEAKPEGNGFGCDGCVAKGDWHLCRELPDCPKVIWVRKE